MAQTTSFSLYFFQQIDTAICFTALKFLQILLPVRLVFLHGSRQTNCPQSRIHYEMEFCVWIIIRPADGNTLADN